MHHYETPTSHLIGVFDAGGCESPSFLGDAQIQPPQEVGLRARGVKLALRLQERSDVSLFFLK